VNLHLNESEQAIAKDRVLEATHDTIYTKTEKELLKLRGTNKNLTQAFWRETLTEYKFGKGVEHLLLSRYGEEGLDTELVERLKEPYNANPAKRSTKQIDDYLSYCEELDEATFRYLLYKSVEQVGLTRTLSDELLMLILKYIARSLFNSRGNRFINSTFTNTQHGKLQLPLKS